MASIRRIDDRQDVSAVRILVVEDFEPLRLFICSMLAKNPEFQVVGEVSDGMEAVCKAEELQPNLILLDVGLPTLDGIEAARHIRELSPESKIIFVSQESSADVVQEAISLGAWGYVVKTRAASDLLAAVQAVCEGKRFVSRELWVQNLTDANSQQESNSERWCDSFPQ
jgi:DNA-binding NarL/FixJ family response regulator